MNSFGRTIDEAERLEISDFGRTGIAGPRTAVTIARISAHVTIVTQHVA